MERVMKTIPVLILMAIFHYNGYGQTHAITTEIIQRTITKSKAIQSEYRVIEKTFGDFIFTADTIGINRLYKHFFSSSNHYRINAFASAQAVSDLDIGIYKLDADNKFQKVTSDNSYGSDVNLTFTPSESNYYYVFITGTLKSGYQAAFFNIIIDRQ
jgi:hypothetical protein